MQISSRFSIGVHILSLLAVNSGAHLTSEWIAGSVGTNPVVIRRVTGQLKKAGLVEVRAGSGGATLARGLESITLLDVYRAVDAVEEGKLFHMHEQPNPNCEVGANIEHVLRLLMLKAQDAMEGVLGAVTMRELVDVLAVEIKRSAVK
ncbi:Rrf2 family transcriptional regulator [Paenibacillus sacheonensis]|uniref:Transcriptional regulator n=1 Tax=Paenibacillus sacheonensis TaxID=742054 RepID=A0A7X4YTP4_9BACL|nr:Rrf2 family transcriptional regulator [Paenibacillus sacheonensis]MBM7568560.1 Rrf2 family protein [Paenibacillus sacheonensis]NBC72383.1 transcriptional regulator [Paenibacillus sacheonensis]